MSLEVRDLVFETGDEANDSFEPLIVKPADGRMVKNEYPLYADGNRVEKGVKDKQER